MLIKWPRAIGVKHKRDRFELRTSELVVLEASAGDARAAELRLAVLRPLTLVDPSARPNVLRAHC